MHCRACDALLSDKEATRRATETGEYPDLCDGCLDELDVVDNPFADEEVHDGDSLFDQSVKGE